jgi:hypothetical protein
VSLPSPIGWRASASGPRPSFAFAHNLKYRWPSMQCLEASFALRK